MNLFASLGALAMSLGAPDRIRSPWDLFDRGPDPVWGWTPAPRHKPRRPSGTDRTETKRRRAQNVARLRAARKG